MNFSNSILVLLYFLCAWVSGPIWYNNPSINTAIIYYLAIIMFSVMLCIVFRNSKGFLLSWMLTIIGHAMNATVIIANNGYMPVKGFYGIKDGHIGYTLLERVNLSFLADRFDASWCIYSIGDVFLLLAFTLFIVYTLLETISLEEKRSYKT